MSNLINPYRFAVNGELPTLFEWDPVNGTSLPSGTFTRASVAEEYDGTDFTQVSSGTIRENSAAVSGGAKGYLSEPAATNLVLDADDLGNGGVWTTLSLTPEDQGVVTPLGFRTWRLDAGLGTNSHFMVTGITGTGVTSFSVRAKDFTGQYFSIRADNTDANKYAIFDTVGGTITEDVGLTDKTMTALGGGWHDCTTHVTTTVNRGINLALSNSATPGTSNPNFTGANEEVDLTIPQVEATAFSTSPIVTSGSTVTREADVLDTDETIASEFGVLLDVTLPRVIGAGNTITLFGPDATAEDILRVAASGDVIMDDGGTPVTVGTATLGTRIKVAYGRDATGRSGSLDGATAVTGGAPGSGHEGDTFQIGAANSVNQSRCIHHETVIYSVRPSDSQLEALSS